MTKEEIKALESDREGLVSYEFLVNHLYELSEEQLNRLIDALGKIDLAGQYLASGARYLHAVDAEHFRPFVDRMVAMTIDRDREHRYIGSLTAGLYGEDFAENASKFADDDNFRRLYKRLYPESVI